MDGDTFFERIARLHEPTSHDQQAAQTLDIYGRPWPYMALIRERIAMIDPNLADTKLGN
jgi:hypothetical protein